MPDLNKRIRTAHSVAGIRSFPAPETVHASKQSHRAGTAPAPVAPTPVPTSQPPSDGLARVGIIAALDAQHRLAAGKVTRPLGWEPGTRLIARCSGDRVTISAGTAASPADTTVVLDADRRLTLPPAAIAVLDLRAGRQAVAIAVPAAGELVLLCASAALALLTGPITVPSVPADTPAPAAPTGRSSRVRERWQPAEVA